MEKTCYVVKEPDGNLMFMHAGADAAQAVSTFIATQKRCVQLAIQMGSPHESIVNQTWDQYKLKGYSVVRVEIKEVPEDLNECSGCGMPWHQCLCSHE